MGPYCKAVDKNRENDGMENQAPVGEVQTVNRVAHDTEGLQCGPSTGGHGLDVVLPVEVFIENMPR